MTQTRFTPELWATVLERVSNGESMRQVCRTEGFPPEATIRNWIRSDQELATRVLQVESWADQVRDEAFREDLEPNDKRVRDALKWLLSKLKPERYGLERLLVMGDPSSPIQHLHKQVNLSDLSDAQLDALRSFTQTLLIDATPTQMLFEMAKALRSLIRSPIASALHEARRMARPQFHFEEGGVVPTHSRPGHQHGENDFVLPPDIDASEVT
jgi:hypothetical protein